MNKCICFLLLVSILYLTFKIVSKKYQDGMKEGFFEQSYIDVVVPNQIKYWDGRKKGITQDYDSEKFYELDVQGDLRLTSRDETYKRYTGDDVNHNYIGPLKRHGDFIAIEGYNIDVLKNISLEKCKNKCDQLNNCQGISYHSEQKKCSLEEHSCANAPEACKTNTSGWRAYEKLETNDKMLENETMDTSFKEPVHDITILGSNIKHIKKTTLQKCLKKCHKNPMCAAASFRKKECYLEGKTCKQAGKKCVRGKKAKGWTMYELLGIADDTKNNYYPIKIHNKNASIKGYNYKELKAFDRNKCREQCDRKGNQCKGFEYNKKNKKCMLSSSICRSVGKSCSNKNTKGYVSYEKIKYLGPYYIVCRQVYNQSPYLAMKTNTKRGTSLIMSSTKNDFSKWLFYPDGSIQNVATELFISYSGDLEPGTTLVAGTTRRRWFVEKSKGKAWNPTHWAGNIFYIKDKDYFIFNRKNRITLEVETKKGKKKNPNYATCKKASGTKYTKGDKYIYSGETVSKIYKRAQWSLVKTSL